MALAGDEGPEVHPKALRLRPAVLLAGAHDDADAVHHAHHGPALLLPLVRPHA